MSLFEVVIVQELNGARGEVSSPRFIHMRCAFKSGFKFAKKPITPSRLRPTIISRCVHIRQVFHVTFRRGQLAFIHCVEIRWYHH